MEKKVTIKRANQVGAESLGECDYDIGMDLTCQTSLMAQWLDQMGFRVRPDVDESKGVFFYDPLLLDKISEVANQIVEEEKRDPEDRPTWARFGLTSDDDVDYNGGYIRQAVTVAKAIESEQEGQWIRDITMGDEVENAAYKLAKLIVAHLNDYHRLVNSGLKVIEDTDLEYGIEVDYMLALITDQIIAAAVKTVILFEENSAPSNGEEDGEATDN